MGVLAMGIFLHSHICSFFGLVSILSMLEAALYKRDIGRHKVYECLQRKRMHNSVRQK